MARGGVALRPRLLASLPDPLPRTAPLPAPDTADIGCTHSGQVCRTFIHDATQSAWKECAQGSLRISSPFSNSPRQMAHSVCENASLQFASYTSVGKLSSTRCVNRSWCCCRRSAILSLCLSGLSQARANHHDAND